MRVETSSIDELTEMHRMGHTCANLNGELFFVWGGWDDSEAYQVARNNHLWIYETLTGYCRHRSCSGECPPQLSATSSALINQKMYIFGGHSTAIDNWLNSLYCLDLDTFVWKDLGSQAKGEPTKPIRSDKLVSWSYRNKLYLFGGYGWSQIEHLLQLLDKQKDLQLVPDHRWPKFGWNNQLVEFDPLDNTWRWPSYSGKCPSARAAHSGALMGNKYYIFGGRDSRERLNDLYTLDMETFEWNQIAIVSDPNGGGRLERPIRHLLESAESLEELELDQGDNRDVMDEMRRDTISVVDEEELTPSPSTGLQDIATTNDCPVELAIYDDDDDDDNDDYPSEYPHPSHLLERWSLSSSQTASCSANLDDSNCLQFDSQPLEDVDEETRSHLDGQSGEQNDHQHDNTNQNRDQHQQLPESINTSSSRADISPIPEEARMDRIQPPGELGFMILSEDGRLADSGGDLKNKERVASIIFQMKNAFEASSNVLSDNVHSLTIQYEDHLYVLVFEPRRSLVVKRRRSLSASSA